jgi:hypothetical protein
VKSIIGIALPGDRHFPVNGALNNFNSERIDGWQGYSKADITGTTDN